MKTAIQALRDNPRKGSTPAAIKGFMAEEWGINIQTYAPRIKKYLQKGVDNGELIQTKGRGASGRFTVPGLKARKKKARAKRLSKKFDEDVVEYEPGKSARDEAREQTEVSFVCTNNKSCFCHMYLSPLGFENVKTSTQNEIAFYSLLGMCSYFNLIATRSSWQSGAPVWRRRRRESSPRKR